LRKSVRRGWRLLRQRRAWRVAMTKKGGTKRRRRKGWQSVSHYDKNEGREGKEGWDKLLKGKVNRQKRTERSPVPYPPHSHLRCPSSAPFRATCTRTSSPLSLLLRSSHLFSTDSSSDSSLPHHPSHDSESERRSGRRRSCLSYPSLFHCFDRVLRPSPRERRNDDRSRGRRRRRLRTLFH
jgi:hypothetical protein